MSEHPSDQSSEEKGFWSSLLPRTGWGRLLLAGILIWFINWVFSSEGMIAGSAWLKAVIDFASFLALVPFIYALYRGARWVVEHLLWRLRRRLVVTYFLIGALPLVLVLVLVALIGYVVIMQSSANLVARQLNGYLEQSQSAAIALSRDLQHSDLRSLDAAQSPALRKQLEDRSAVLAPVFPEIALSVSRPGASSHALEAVAGAKVREVSSAAALPRWLAGREQFHGLVVVSDGERGRHVRAHHLIRSGGTDPWIFQLSYPIGTQLAEHLTRATGLAVAPEQATLPFVRTPSGEQVIDQQQLGAFDTGSTPAPFVRYPIITAVTDWNTGREMESDVLSVDLSFLRLGQIWQRIEQFRTGSVIGAALVTVIGGLSIIFLLIALAASVSAIFLTRSITGAVHKLYQGTQRIEAGDLDHEIAIRGRDQLSALAHSFNQMTRSVRELLRVSAEKQRLDQEMRIAGEVQARLFPREVPRTETLDVAPGVCIPARSVSGDYYDFLDVAPGVFGLVVADVCGKGVSAALMMANLQANLRGQVLAYRDAYRERIGMAAHEGGEDSPASSATLSRVRRIVGRANRQLTGSMMDANFVTLFYAEIDEQSATLSYTNAGHNPPLLVRAGRRDASGRPQIERLECGGTVIGLFREVEYEDAELVLESGDALVAFTDGLIEARSPQGQEFGEERLIGILARSGGLPAAELEKLLLKSVREWTGGAEQEDDLTLVIVKKR